MNAADAERAEVRRARSMQMRNSKEMEATGEESDRVVVKIRQFLESHPQ